MITSRSLRTFSAASYLVFWLLPVVIADKNSNANNIIHMEHGNRILLYVRFSLVLIEEDDDGEVG